MHVLRIPAASAVPIALFLLALALVAPAGALQAPPGYYAGVDTSNAASLRATLHGAIDDHLRFPYTSGGTDTWDILELAQEDPNDAGRILDVYRNASYAKQGGGNSFYQREHSWPNSFGFPSDSGSNYPYTDCHALFLADGGYNGIRANKPFRFCDPTAQELPTLNYGGVGGGFGQYPGQSNWTSGNFDTGSFEVWADRRGDLARALFYLDVRYEGGFHGGTGAAEPDLILTDDQALISGSATGFNESVAHMGLLSVLRLWHEQDPVDAREMARNNVVQSFQGNRNPFVDHPEWVGLLFDGPAGSSVTPWINEFHYDNVGADVGEFVEIAGPAGLDLAGYRVLAYNGADGFSYDDVDLGGVIPDLGNCMGVLAFDFPGLQNGAPDGLLLVDPLGQPLHGLSYEGFFNISLPSGSFLLGDIGVAEDGATPVGWSLSLTGFGDAAGDFVWQGPAPESRGQVNPGQVLVDNCAPQAPVPAPTGLAGNSCAGGVQLSWTPGAVAQPAGFDVYRSTSSGFGFAKLNPAPLAQPSYLDLSGLVGTTYYYRVTALDAVLGASDPSAELVLTVQGVSGASTPWINEFHYDNDGPDVGEFVEVAGPAGLNLAGYRLVAYNGANGLSYASVNLSGSLPDQGGCVGALAFPFVGLQNGSPDGIALVDPSDQVLEFLSYEGTFQALNGPALGLFGTDIGVAEASNAPVGTSLQRGGSGSSAADFALWQPSQAESPGAVNLGQSFVGGCGGSVTTLGCGFNPPGSLTLLPGPLQVGAVLQFAIDNPLGTQTPGSIAALALSLFPAAPPPCGIPVPGLGMAGPGAVGEVLISLAPGQQLPPLLAPGWLGAGQSKVIAVALPFVCSLAGLEFYAQGAILDPFGPLGLGLTEALRIQLAP